MTVGLDGQANCAKTNVHQADLVPIVNVNVCVNMEEFVIVLQVAVAAQLAILVMPASMHVQEVGMVLPVKAFVIAQMVPVVIPKQELAFVFLGGLETIVPHVAQLVAMVMVAFITAIVLELRVIT